jgi:hypothetical protein
MIEYEALAYVDELPLLLSSAGTQQLLKIAASSCAAQGFGYRSTVSRILSTVPWQFSVLHQGSVALLEVCESLQDLGNIPLEVERGAGGAHFSKREPSDCACAG